MCGEHFIDSHCPIPYNLIIIISFFLWTRKGRLRIRSPRGMICEFLEAQIFGASFCSQPWMVAWFSAPFRLPSRNAPLLRSSTAGKSHLDQTPTHHSTVLNPRCLILGIQMTTHLQPLDVPGAGDSCKEPAQWRIPIVDL